MQASPPDVGDQRLEPLTPSPVVLSQQPYIRYDGLRYLYFLNLTGTHSCSPAQSSVQEGVSLELSTPQPSELQQVRVVDFPVHQTPRTKTPGHASRGRKSSLKISRGTEC